MSKDERDRDQIQIGQTPRVYAPGSIVDDDEEVDNGPEDDAELRAGQSPHRVTPQEADEELGKEHPDREDTILAGAAPPPTDPAATGEYEVVHNEEPVPNYRDEVYRDPDQTLLEGQDAATYDEQKEAVSDGSRFIPRDDP